MKYTNPPNGFSGIGVKSRSFSAFPNLSLNIVCISLIFSLINSNFEYLFLIKRISKYKPKLYVAGKFADGSYVNKHIEKLEALGYTITHNWTKVEDSKEHTTDELAKYAAADIDGVVAADYLIVIITDPTYPYRGSCSELGAALALKKKVFVLYDLPKESTGYYSNIFAKHALVSNFSSMSDLIAALEQYCAQCHESLGEGYACADCDEQICRTCVLSGTIQLEEWLDVSNHC